MKEKEKLSSILNLSEVKMDIITVNVYENMTSNKIIYSTDFYSNEWDKAMNFCNSQEKLGYCTNCVSRSK